MPRIRTFLGIDLGAKIRDRLVSLQEDLALEAPDVKWVEPDNLHPLVYSYAPFVFCFSRDLRATADVHSR